MRSAEVPNHSSDAMNTSPAPAPKIPDTPNPDAYYRDAAAILGRIAHVMNADSREGNAEEAWVNR